MSRSKIEWTNTTWNPTRGCTRVSEGCRNCYAERQAVRQSGPLGKYHGLVRSTPSGPRWTGEMEFVEEKLVEPLHWREPRKVFVNSMSDLFHEAIAFEQIDRVWVVMALCPQHIFQILTKRAERQRQYGERRIEYRAFIEMAARVCFARDFDSIVDLAWQRYREGLENVWLGVSVENQDAANERIPQLVQTQARLRFLSVEPLIAATDLERVPKPVEWTDYEHDWLDLGDLIDWVIVGGESGPGARPCDVRWIRAVVEQCRSARVPVFVKQLGTKPLGYDRARRVDDSWGRIPLRSKKGGDPAEWPEDLRVREFPGGAA